MFRSVTDAVVDEEQQQQVPCDHCLGLSQLRSGAGAEQELTVPAALALAEPLKEHTKDWYSALEGCQLLPGLVLLAPFSSQCS